MVWRKSWFSIKNSKRCSQAMYSDGEHSTGNFGTIPQGKFSKFCLKPPAALTPRVHMGPIVETAVPRRSAELPPPCLSKDVPHDRSLRSLSNSVSHFRFCSSFSFFILSKLTLKANSVSRWTLSKSALRAAISSDTDITLSLGPSPFGHGCPVKVCTPLFRLTNVYTSPLWPDWTHTSLAVPVPSRSQLEHSYTISPVHKMCTSPLGPTKHSSHANTPLLTPGPIYWYIVLGCGSFVRGRKRKKGDSIPFILPRRDYISRLHDECPQRASTTSDKLSSIPIIYIRNPSSTWQSSNGA